MCRRPLGVSLDSLIPNYALRDGAVLHAETLRKLSGSSSAASVAQPGGDSDSPNAQEPVADRGRAHTCRASGDGEGADGTLVVLPRALGVALQHVMQCHEAGDARWGAESRGLVAALADIDKQEVAADGRTVSESQHQHQHQQQMDLTGDVASSWDDLYEAAEAARPLFKRVVHRALAAAGLSKSMLLLGAVKPRQAAADKARVDYCARQPGPALSWLFDVVRGRVVCDSEDEICRLVTALLEQEKEEGADLEVVRLKNRFVCPVAGGYRDLLLSLRIHFGDVEEEEEDAGMDEIDGAVSRGIYHTCELQIQLMSVEADNDGTGSRASPHYGALRDFLYSESGRRRVAARMALLRELFPAEEGGAGDEASLSFDESRLDAMTGGKGGGRAGSTGRVDMNVETDQQDLRCLLGVSLERDLSFLTGLNAGSCHLAMNVAS